MFEKMEMKVLAGAICDSQKRYSWLGELTTDHFNNYNHKLIFDIINENKDLSAHDLSLKIEYIAQSKGFDVEKFVNFVDAEGSYCNEIHSVNELKRFKRYNDVSRLFHNINPKDPATDDVQALLEHIATSSTKKQMEKMNTRDALMRIYNTITNPDEDFATSKPTGWNTFDGLTGGIRNGMYFLGAKPGCGKTTFALQLLFRYAETHPDELVVFHSLEMALDAMSIKLASLSTKLTEKQFKKASKHHTHSLPKNEAAQFMHFFKKAPENLIIVSHESLTPFEFKNVNDELIRDYKKPIGFACIDYIQIMSSDNPKLRDETSRVQSISNGLRPIAKDNYPVLCLAQLLKSVEKTEKPTAGALKDTSQMEQDAVGIMFLSDDEATGEIILSIVKNRFGKGQGSRNFHAHFEQNRFEPVYIEPVEEDDNEEDEEIL